MMPLKEKRMMVYNSISFIHIESDTEIDVILANSYKQSSIVNNQSSLLLAHVG